jgi:hypothetical protein
MIPLSGRVPGRASGPSRSLVDDGVGLQYFSWMDVQALGFSRWSEFIGRRAMPEGAQGAHTTGWLIRLKRIYNFWCSMLVLHHLLHVLFTLSGVFMRFPELTYWKDATVPVPCFLLFLCFRKATQEIFSELDKTTTKTPIFPGRRTRTVRESEGARGQAHHRVVRPPPSRAT